MLCWWGRKTLLNPIQSIMYVVQYLDATHAKTSRHYRAEDCFGMICHRSSLIRQSCHFERDFDSVLLQLADTLNTQFKYQLDSWHSLLKRLKC